LKINGADKTLVKTHVSNLPAKDIWTRYSYRLGLLMKVEDDQSRSI